MATVSLFDNDKYTAHANDLARETHNALKTIFARYKSAGFSARDIAHVMHGTVTDVECSLLLDLDSETSVKGG